LSYAGLAATPPDESAQTQSVLATTRVREVSPGRPVPLRYVNINTDLEHSYWLRIWDFPHSASSTVAAKLPDQRHVFSAETGAVAAGSGARI
jgi:hypothetical protein